MKTVKDLLNYYRTQVPYIDDPTLEDLYNDILKVHDQDIILKNQDINELRKIIYKKTKNLMKKISNMESYYQTEIN